MYILWLYIPDHPYRILISGGSGSGKTHELLNLIKEQNDFDNVVKELFIRCRKLIISLVFITQSYFFVPKKVRLNSTYYLIMKIYNQRELQNIPINHSANIDYGDFLKVYKKYTSEPYSFMAFDTTLPTRI